MEITGRKSYKFLPEKNIFGGNGRLRGKRFGELATFVFNQGEGCSVNL